MQDLWMPLGGVVFPGKAAALVRKELLGALNHLHQNPWFQMRWLSPKQVNLPVPGSMHEAMADEMAAELLHGPPKTKQRLVISES